MPNPNLPIPSAQMPKGTLPRTNPLSPRSLPGEGDWERITPAIQAKVWKKRFGFRKTGTCVCCHQRTIFRDDFVCGHRRAYAGGGGSDVSNLEPICGRCHEKMGTHDLVSWCKKFQEELKAVKPMPKTTAKKTVRKATAKKTVRKTTAKKAVRKMTAKKSSSKKAKR